MFSLNVRIKVRLFHSVFNHRLV